MFCYVFLFVVVVVFLFSFLPCHRCWGCRAVSLPTAGSRRTVQPAAAEFWLRADHTASTWRGTSSWRKASCSTSWWGRRERTPVPPWVSTFILSCPDPHVSKLCCLAESWKNECYKQQQQKREGVGGAPGAGPTPACGCTGCIFLFFPWKVLDINTPTNSFHWFLRPFWLLCIILLISHQVWNLRHHRLSPRENWLQRKSSFIVVLRLAWLLTLAASVSIKSHACCCQHCKMTASKEFSCFWIC